MLGYNVIEEFVNNIFYSRGKNVGDALSVWVREIVLTDCSLSELFDAEKEIMNDETIELKIPTIKKIIESKKEPKKVIPYKHYCEWCRGTGLVTITARFDNEYKYTPSQDVALRCTCKNASTDTSILQVKLENRNCETKIKNGYILAWKNIMDRQSYLKRVRENKGYDFMKIEKTKGA